MKFWTTLFAGTMIFIGCVSPRSKRHLSTAQLCRFPDKHCPCHVYVEFFAAFEQGAFGTGVDALYLTDSTNFRIYIGTYDEENEAIVTECINGGDSIRVRKYVSNFSRWGNGDRGKIVDSKTYSFSDLKMRKTQD